MKIWHFTDLDIHSVGGVQKCIQNINASLKKRGHEVYVGTIPPSFHTKEPLIFHTHGDRWVFPWQIKKIRRQLNLKWIHICHGTTLGRMKACREILTRSGWRGCALEFSLIHSADAAVAVSPQALMETKRYFRLTCPSTSIMNGVDPKIFKPLQEITQTPRVVFLGRALDRVKNTKMLLNACAIIREQHSELECWMAPGIEEDPRLMAKYPFVKNLGAQTSDGLAVAMAQCRALVLCSFYEADPLVLHEAKALGLPIIASDIPPSRNNLNGYTNSILINPYKVESLVDGILKMCFATKQIQPQPIIRSWDVVAKEYEAFYQTILKNS